MAETKKINATVDLVKSGVEFKLNGGTILSDDGTSHYLHSQSNLYLYSGSSNTMVLTSSGNVGIGTTSPTYKFEVSNGTQTGTFNPNSSGFMFLGSTSNHPLYFGVNDSTKVAILSSGNVGIGTTSPSGSLHVYKSAGQANVIVDAGGNNAYFFANNGANWGLWGFQAQPFTLATNSSERFRITSDGNVGIGSTSPSDKLEVIGNIGIGSNMIYNGASSNSAALDFTGARANIYGYYGIHFYSSTAGVGGQTERMRITNTGLVGIGTTSPGAKLDITTDHTSQIPIRVTHNNYNDWLIQKRRSDDTQKLGIKEVNSNGGMGFATADTVRMVIDSSGNVGIGTTSPSNLLHIHASGNNASALIIEDDDRRLQLGRDMIEARSANGSTVANLYIQPNGNTAFATTTGNVGIGTTSPVAKFHIQGTNSTNGGIRLHNAGGNPYSIWSDNNNFYISQGNGSTTAISVTYAGNVGIGTTSPNGKLQVDGDIYVNGADRKIMNYNGAVDYGTLTNNSVRFNTAGTEKVRISGEGNVGIGLTDPDSRLDVNHGAPGITAGPTVRISKGGSPVGLIRYDTLVIEADDVPTIRMGENDGTVSTIMSGDSNLRINSTHPIKFYTAGTTTGEAHAGQGGTFAMIIDNSQNVGIGTTSPFSKLEVLQSASGTPLSLRSQGGNSGNVGIRFSIADNTVTTDAYNKAAIYLAGAGTTNALGDMVFAVNNSASSQNVSLTDERMRITRDGNVGIGTTSPTSQLTISDPTSPTLEFNRQGSTANGWIKTTDSSQNVEAAIQMYGNEMRFYTNGQSNQRMVIDSSGNVGIGTTSPAFKLDVNGDGIRSLRSSSGWAGWFENTASSSGVVVTAGVDSGDAPLLIRKQDGTELFSVRGNGTSWFNNGNVGIGTTSPIQTFDLNGVAYFRGGTAADFGVGDTPSDTAIIIDEGDYIYTRDNNNLRKLIGKSGSDIIYIGQTGTSLIDGISLQSGQSGYVSIVNGDNGEYARFTGGSLGIGTTSPTRTLHVVGGDSGTGTHIAHFEGRFGVVGMYIRGDGNVGIGTTSPISELHVVGSARVVTNDSAGGDTLIGAINGVSNGYRILTNTSNEITYSWNTGDNVQAVTINNSGNVGIGTTSPENRLHLLTSTTDTTQQLLIQNGSTGDAAIKFNISGKTYSLGIDNSDDDKFKLSAGNLGTNDRLVVDSSGNVGIGTTSPQQKLDVNGNAYINGILYVSGTDPYIWSVGTNALRIKHTDGQTMYIRPDESGIVSFFEGSSGQSVNFMTSTPSVNDTSNNSTSLKMQTRSKTSGGTNQSRTSTIIHKTTDISNNVTQLEFTGASKYYFDNTTNFNGDTTSYGYLQSYGWLYHRQNIVVLNKAANGWVTWAGRNTSGTETVIDLAYIGTLSTSGSVTFSNYASGLLQVDANGLVSVDSSSYSTFSGDYADLTNKPSIPVSGTDFDPVGTDNSTDVSLVTTNASYLTLNGQEITLNKPTLGELNGGTTAGYLQTDSSGNITAGTITTSDTLNDVTTNGNTTTNSITVGGLFASGSGTVFKVNPNNTAKEWYIDSTNPDQLKKEGNLILSADPGNTHASTNINFNIDNANKMRLQSDGKLGIGTTSPAYLLDVAGTIRATGDVIAYSDARVKENVETIHNALEKVKGMRGVNYNKIGDDKRSVGVIAQELLEVLPEAVHQDDQGMYSVAYGNIVGVLIESIKELEAKVEQLENKLNGTAS